MKLIRLAWITAAGCGLGIVLLAIAAVLTFNRFNANHVEIRRLFVLEARLNDTLENATTLIAFGTEPSQWRDLQEEAQAIQAELELLGIDHPDARKGALHLQTVLDTLRSLRLSDMGSGPPQPDHSHGDGPLHMSLRGQSQLNQVLSHGAAARSAVEDAVLERERVLVTTLRREIMGFGGVALILFGLALMGSHWTYFRMRAPIKELLRTIELVRRGDLTAKARVTGSDELAELGQQLNRLVDSRLNAERALQERQQHLEEVLDEHGKTRDRLVRAQQVAAIGSWEVDFAAGRLVWSDQVFEIFGIRREDFGGTEEAFFGLVHPDDREWLLNERAAWLERGGDLDAEHRIVRPDGEVRWVRERAQVFARPDGQPARTVGTVQDITDSKQAEFRLQQYRRLIEGSRDMYAIADASWRYVMVNRSYADRLSKTPRELEGASARDILGAEYFDRELLPRLERALAGESVAFETERCFPDIGTRQLLARYYPIASPDGAIDHVGAVNTDVTDLKEVSRELHRQHALIEIAGRIARLGGWSVDLSGREPEITWSPVVCEIHGMPAGHQPSLEEGISFYAPEWRDRITERFTACVEEGTPYDEELEIINAQGERVWVRAAGQPVRDAGGRIVGVEGAFQDISGPKALEQERTGLARRMRTILESVTDAFFNLDHQWRFDYLNDEAERLLGMGRSELYGRVVWDVFPGAVGTRIEQEYRRAVSEGVPVQLEEYYPPLEKWFAIQAYPSEDGLAVFFRDTSDAHLMVEQLREQERKLRRSRDDLAELLATRQALIDSLPAHIALLDSDGTIVDVNNQWRHFGVENDYPDDTFGVGSNYPAICESAYGDCVESARETAAGIRAVLSGKRDGYVIEYPCHSPDEERWFRMMATRLTGNNTSRTELGAVVMHVNITERKLAERELNRLAYEDPLTGLYSRSGFVQQVSDRIRQSRWDKDALVAAVNVSGLHDVNQAHGFAAGDTLLSEVGRRLMELDRDDGVVGRTGGDDFVVYLGGGRDPADRIAALEALFERPFELPQAIVQASAHIGYTILGNHRRGIDDLLHEASVALAHNRHTQFIQMRTRYTRDLDERSSERIHLNRELRQALERDELELHFQPQVSLPDGELVSAEALLRWNHPTRGLLSPGSFIESAEQSQLIGPIGDWVVQTACDQLTEWRGEGLEVVRLSINVSLVQFMISDFTQTIQRALSKQGVPPSALCLEVTESVFEQESDALLATMRSLSDAGIRLSLDDFGTGYSSLLYLQRYPFDEIKIDRQFVCNVIEDTYSRHIIETVLGLGRALGADVVAEGVESRAVADALLTLGCSRAQGFYFAKPLEAAAFRRVLAGQSRLPRVGSGGDGQA